MRTRSRLSTRYSTITMGAANSQPRVWPMTARPPRSEADVMKIPRSHAGTSRREASVRLGKNHMNQSATSAFG